MTDLLHLNSSPGIFELLLLLVSIVAGAFGALLGLGGGVVIVPILTLGLGINIRYAIGASIVSVIATSSGAAATYVKDHLTNIRVAMLLEVATTIGALSGAVLSTVVPERELFCVFSGILFYSAWVMFRRRHLDQSGERGLPLSNKVQPLASTDYWARRFKLNSSYPDHVLGKEISYSVKNVPLGFLLMLGAGVISGLLGIGSGALKVPAMDSAMKLPIKVSSATSNFMIGVTAAASAGAYYMRGDILPMLAAPVALGVLLGSMVGTRLMMRWQSQRIRVIFIGVLVVIAIQMGLRAFGIRVR